ncbi:protease modulator HflC [Fangia hongkongensis]|uniref:protease modulator HflC n=1 Tax=Fangia hongkongensis TaxID=270495 RepID=UPI000367491E|nr:protease modulator HflC [Fangia hongkongensis]MBK2125521.1 protease modulator HflC [Fangia hongkongensis]
MSNKMMALIVLVIIVVIVLFSSVFRVTQGTESVILKLGELNKNPDGTVKVYQPGLHFKIPLVEQVKTYDMRLRTLPVDESRVVTNEQKDVIIDAYLEWKISNISQYYRSVAGSDARAVLLLKQFLEASLRAEVGKTDIQGLINNQRDELMQTLTKSVGAQAKRIGIDVIDVRIKQIDLPESVTDSIYQRMRSERQKVAASIRAQGEQLSESIRANADATVTITLATADRDAKEIKAKALAEAADIYAKSYAQSEKFYDFWRSMRAYQTSFDNKEGDVFILKPEGKFFKHFDPNQLASNTNVKRPLATS